MTDDKMKNIKDEMRDVLYSKLMNPIYENIIRTPLPESMTVQDINDMVDQLQGPIDNLSRAVQASLEEMVRRGE